MNSLKATREGRLAAFYTQNGYSVSVYPALDIYKVKFSFFKINNKNENFDVYMEAPIYLDLVDSILDRTQRGLQALIAAEAAQKVQYPGAWKSGPMGENGSNQIIIGASQKGGITLQGKTSLNGKGVNAFIPVPSFAELKDMARLSDAVFKMWQEEQPVQGISGFYKQRANIILAEMSKFKHNDVPEDKALPEDVVSDEPQQKPAPDEVSATDTTVVDSSDIGEMLPFTNGGFKAVEVPKEADDVFELKTTSGVKQNGEHRYFETKDANGKKILLVFNPDSVTEMGKKFGELSELANSKTVKLKVRGRQKGNQVVFESMAS